MVKDSVRTKNVFQLVGVLLILSAAKRFISKYIRSIFAPRPKIYCKFLALGFKSSDSVWILFHPQPTGFYFLPRYLYPQTRTRTRTTHECFLAFSQKFRKKKYMHCCSGVLLYKWRHTQKSHRHI